MNEQKQELDNLGVGSRWVGDNIGCQVGEEVEIIELKDDAGHIAYVSYSELVSHPVWNRLDNYSRKRINYILEL